MAGKICRLCFGAEPKPIGIFTAKGLRMNIKGTIQLHLLDEVSYSVSAVAARSKFLIEFSVAGQRT